MNISRTLLEHSSVPSLTATYIFSLGGEASKTDRNKELAAWGNLEDLSNFGKSRGTKATGQAQDYFSALASGDEKKIAQAIAPQTAVIQGQAQQQKNQLAEFGNRSGGTNAGAQMIDTNSAKAVQDLINTLVPEANKELANLGMEELGLSANTASTLGSQTEQAREFDKQQEANLGGGIFSVFKPILKAGAGMIPGVGPLLSAGLS